MPSINNTDAEKFLLELENSTNEFFTYHNRPIYSEDNFTLTDSSPKVPISIVIQGPIVDYKSFTYETIKLYKKIYPFATIILSTWSDTSDEQIQLFNDLDIKINLNNKPDYSGISNVNYQIASTSSGIEIAKSCGAQFVLKTRTDIRLNAPDFFLYCLNLLSSFPLSTSAQLKLNCRLLSISEGNKYALCMTPDKNMFGHIDDMLIYWRIPFDYRNLERDFNNQLEMAEFGIAESYFFNNFIKNHKINFEYTLSSYWSIIRDYFMVADASDADLYWCKYNRAREFKNRHYFGTSSFDSFSFKDWLRLYVGTFPIKNNNSIILRKHGAILNDLI